MELVEPELDLVPVQIEHVRDHRFEKWDGRGCGLVKLDGKTCGRQKNNPLHYGAVPSLNTSGSGANRFAYQSAKKALQERFIELLEESELPKGLSRVLVEGEMCFPDRGRRDQGNFRYFCEKVLGDALVEGGWLEDDDWSRYEFGGLAHRYEKGETWTRLMIFPS